MFNLKNALLTLTLALGTIALADQAFTPKLIIKNISEEKLIFDAPRYVIEQLLQEKNRNRYLILYDRGINPELVEHIPKSHPLMFKIKINPNDTLVFNSIPEFLTSMSYDGIFEHAYTTFLSPEECFKRRADSATLVEPGSYCPDVKSFISPEDLNQAKLLKQDILIHLAKSEHYGSSAIYQCAPHQQYLEITKTELVNRA